MADSWKENRARYERSETRGGSGFDRIPTGAVLAVMGVVFCWAVNTLSPGAINLVTGLPFADSLILGAVIGLAGQLIHSRWRAWHFDIDEIEEVAENALSETDRRTGSQAGRM